MTISQYYNESKQRMEVPIYTGDNYISYTSLINTTLNELSINAVVNDVIACYVNGTGWQSATYWGAAWGWWENPGEHVDPIQAGVGYRYNRIGGNTIWYYPVEIPCSLAWINILPYL